MINISNRFEKWPLNPILMFKGWLSLLIFFSLSFLLSLGACLSSTVQQVFAFFPRSELKLLQYSILVLGIGLAVYMFESLGRQRFLLRRQAFSAAGYLQVCLLTAALFAQVATTEFRDDSHEPPDPLTFLVVDIVLSFGLSTGSRLAGVPPLSGPSYTSAKSAATDFISGLSALRDQLDRAPTADLYANLKLAQDGVTRLERTLSETLTYEEPFYHKFVDQYVRRRALITQNLFMAPEIQEAPELLKAIWGEWEQPLPPLMNDATLHATRSLIQLLEDYHAKR